MPKEIDPNVWRKLDDCIGYVPREYWYIGQYRGRQCKVLCRLSERNDNMPGWYRPWPVFAHNVGFTPDWAVIGRDLIPA